jgi:PilZ domain
MTELSTVLLRSPDGDEVRAGRPGTISIPGQPDAQVSLQNVRDQVVRVLLLNPFANLPSDTNLTVRISTRSGTWEVDSHLWAQVRRQRLLVSKDSFKWIERRSNDRIEASVLAEVVTVRGTTSGYTMDVSTGGCRLVVNTTVIVGEHITLRLAIMNRPIRARVAHVSGSTIGVEFLEVPMFVDDIAPRPAATTRAPQLN